jgi:hypothetical protein
MVGRQFSRLARLEELGTNLKGNIKAGLKVTALDLAAAEDKRQQVFLRFRELFERTLRARTLPVDIAEVRLASDPLTATARGALIAAMYEK